MREVTMWYRFDTQTQQFEPNHLGDGHEATDRPAARHASHVKGWSGGKWQKVHCWLTDDVPPRIVYYSPDEADIP